MSTFTTTDFKLPFKERLAGLFSERAMTSKIQDRIGREALDMMTRGVFQASESNRLNAEWSAPINFDINYVLSVELPRIRSRHRWLAFNNASVSSAINSWLNYGVGQGFDLQMNVASITTDAEGQEVVTEFEGFNGLVEDRFDDWAQDVNAASPESNPETFRDVQEMAAQRWMVDGEVFIHMTPHPTKIMQLEFIDPEALDVLKTANGRNKVIMGIELDGDTWRPVAYWVKSKSPETTGYIFDKDSVRIPAEQMVHAFIRKFPRQLRGIPWFSAVQERIFQEGEYTKAQLVRSKIAAMFGVIFSGGKGVGKRLLGSIGGSADSNGNGNGSGSGSPWPTDSSGNPIAGLSPGMVGSVGEGVDVKMVNPTAPEFNYKEFVKVLQTASSSGMDFGMSYQMMTRNMDGLSFAGGRLASQMDVQGIRRFQRMFSSRIPTPIFRKWMDYAYLSGVIRPQTYLQDKSFWQRHEWLPGGWSFSVNPVQEITASEHSMKSRITSFQDECSQRGLNWKAQLRKARKAEQYAERLGLSMITTADQIPESVGPFEDGDPPDS